MFLTSREQKLIQTFLKRGKLTIAEMMEITDTSRRTLYRDLNNLQKSLPENISLENTDEGYFLKGDINQLTQAHELIDYSISERLYGELLLLIENKASIASLTDYFGISQPTVTSDLKQIEQALFKNELVLIRDRGLKLKGAEENIRPVFVAVIYNSASIQELLLNQLSNNKILRIIDLNKFKQVNEAFKRIDLPEKMTDKVKVLMQLFCLVVLLRLDEGYSVSSETLGRPSKQKSCIKTLTLSVIFSGKSIRLKASLTCLNLFKSIILKILLLES
ncbi:helix-turn-helix domain-containing protein [Lactococcus lactis]